eukprot:TRINITY_DN7905_c0_g1_i1.p1 TRINITY_DN7905_c0_g1~~TRINITY_DN7905_c0_g1_i1.p1  ORF type:complete len:357 (+),score=100.36 TRINITY_DN7905_c0_g1_i1:86-1156(+)
MTTQYSTVEAWRRDVAEEDRRLAGAAVGAMEAMPATMKELRAKVSNSPASAVGYKHCDYVDRVFVLIYFPEAAKTPPCYFHFPKTMVVGKIVDRVCAMLELRYDPTDATADEERLFLIRLASHASLPFNAEMQAVATGWKQNEELVLCFGRTLPGVYPAPKRGVREAPAEAPPVETAPPPQDTPEEDKADAEAEALEILPDSPADPPIAALADTIFMNKKFQPKGDASVPDAKRVQVAVFVHIAPSTQQAIYMWLHKDWVTGRCVDHALQTASIRNPNLSVADPAQKVVMYSLRHQRAVPPSVPLGETCIASGDPILLARAGGLPLWCHKESLLYANPPPEFQKQAKKKARECVVM